MKTAVLGVGGMGRHIAGSLQKNPRLEGVVAYDVDAKALARLRESREAPGTTDLDEIMGDPDIGLVFVTASNDAHHDLTLRALEAGKAVMCEKPMATTLAEAREMLEVAEQRGAFLQIGFELRYSHLYTRIRDWIQRGLLGRVVNTHCFYNVGAYWEPDSWRVNEDSGGMFGEKLSHYVDLPRWWIGEDVTEVHSVCAPNIIPYFHVRDNYHTTYRFADGAVSCLTFMMGPPKTFQGDPLQNTLDQQQGDGHALQYTVVGTEGAASISVFERTIKRWRFEGGRGGFNSDWVEQIQWSAEEDHFYFHNTTDQTHDIVRRVLEGRPPKTPARDAYETMKLCFAAEHSADAMRPVRVDEMEADLVSSVR